MHGETIFVPSGWFHQLTTSVYRLLRVELCAVEGPPDVEAQLSKVLAKLKCTVRTRSGLSAARLD